MCYSFAILHCGPTDFNSKGHLVLRTCSEFLRICTILRYFEYSVIQKGFSYCQHEANSKVLAQMYAILSAVQFTTTNGVVGYCKHGVNCKGTALLYDVVKLTSTQMVNGN